MYCICKDHLIVLACAYTDVNYIDEKISDAENIQVFMLMFSYVEIDIPFESISTLSQLKALAIRESPYVSNVCKMFSYLKF